MSLSITINNINDLTDAERAVLRMIVGDKQVTLTGPTATRQFIESIAGDEAAPPQIVREVTVPKLVVEEEATTVPVPPATPIPSSAELDSAGLPWDKRIHSSTRAKIADGTWRKLRGVVPTFVETVEAELRAVQAIPVPVAQHSGEHVPQWCGFTQYQDGDVVMYEGSIRRMTAPAGEFPPVGIPPSTPALVPSDAAPAPAPTVALAEMQAKLDAIIDGFPAAPVPVPPAPLTFADLMKHVTPMLVSGKLPQDTLLAVTAEFGLPHLAALGARPDLVEAVRARIDEVCNG